MLKRWINLLLVAFVLCSANSFAEDHSWVPLDREDLKMTEFKPLPGAEAVLLYYATSDDSQTVLRQVSVQARTAK